MSLPVGKDACWEKLRRGILAHQPSVTIPARPGGLALLAGLLPAGAGLRLFSALLSGSPAGGAAGAVWLWCAAFLILTAALRERRLRSGGEARI